MDVSSSNAANSAARQDPLLGVQIKLFKSAQDNAQSTMETLLGSINTVQPAQSVEPHLGNKIDTRA
ncbi:YjfB family protein [Oceanospirillum beijerinckii]|uniref:YjfB family protein n=1 Tax=Oceanospirillum beijerinckii TaxID=64976 RepID=UPI0003FCF976|nr:YjfB family protein [Oceanospirillum beijerinckii]MAC46284.1 putative motility protein [Oceanospirillum sp.]